MPGSFQKGGSRPDPSSDARDEASARQAAQAFRQGLAEHLQARAELLSLETREAGGLFARKALLGIAAAILLFFAYALLIAGLVSLLGRWLERSWLQLATGIGWPLAAILAGLLHLLLAFVLFNKLKRKPVEKLFEFTRAEFQKDREWLQPNQNPPGNESESSP